ncbi:MAG: hypothetical protein LC790_08385, partial [Actinobacteria bacterium]|nr:hypothetical protein [Actinomycetota bacterium]
RVAASVTGDPERARDAVQDAFAIAVRKRGSFRGEREAEVRVGELRSQPLPGRRGRRGLWVPKTRIAEPVSLALRVAV